MDGIACAFAYMELDKFFIISNHLHGINKLCRGEYKFYPTERNLLRIDHSGCVVIPGRDWLRHPARHELIPCRAFLDL